MLLSYFWNATEQSRLFRRARGPRGTGRWPDSESHWTNQDQQHLSLVVRSFGGGAWEKKQRLLGCDQTVLHRRVDHSGPLTATSTSYGIKADFSLASSLAVLNSVLLGGLFFFFIPLIFFASMHRGQALVSIPAGPLLPRPNPDGDSSVSP